MPCSTTTPALLDRGRRRASAGRSRGSLVAVVVPLLLGLGAATAAVAAADTGSAHAVAGPTAAQRALEGDRTALYDLLDATRAQHGLAPLRRDPGVQGVAQAWAGAMASSGALRHNGSLRLQLPAGSSAGGENVGNGLRGQPVPLHEAWLASPGHRANALSGAYDTVGIGVVHDRRGKLWAVVDFGAYG